MTSRKEKRKMWRERQRGLTIPGTSPGTLTIDPDAPRPITRVMAFGPDTIAEQGVTDLQTIRSFLEKYPVTWVNVDGLGDGVTIEKLGEIFRLHRLSLEDVVNVHQRPKVEQYPEYYFIVARMAEAGERLGTEQLSLFLGKNYVLTFQERHGDCFDTVRDRIRKGGNKIRNSGPDYLAYAVLDAFIDNYFPYLEALGERLEAVEDEVILSPDTQTIAQIHRIKRDLLTMRRALWPLRDALNSLIRESTALITDDTRIYLRDCYDHTIRVIDLLETYREVSTSLTDIYLSSLSNRLNEVMKVLTMFSAIFIPLTFIAGIYGMNFNPENSPWNMPELNWKWGYPLSLAIMLVVAVVMLFYFRRKGWLGSPSPRRKSSSGEGSHDLVQ